MTTTEEKAPPVQRHPPRILTLCLVYSGNEVQLPPLSFPLGRGATPIGREVTGGVLLSRDRRVSRHHATLHTGVLGTIRIVDEKSRNGTEVNGRRVHEALLHDGDVISMGDSYLIVRVEPKDLRDAPVPALLGVSPSMRALRSTIQHVGPTLATVLLLAESGCGKEVVSRALHDAERAHGPFVAINCSAIPESLAESQLFGHLAGAFSGAVARPGLFRAADGGTLFLDEVGDLPLAIQPKLLRVLQDRLIFPVGAISPVHCNVRIVAATNRDLKAEVAEHRFRGDLYARLSEITLHVPPLRDRREDVLLLLVHALGLTGPRLTPALVERLLLHEWPFNVREVFALASQLRIRSAGAEFLDCDLIADRLEMRGREKAEGVAVRPENAEVSYEPEDSEGGEEREPPPDRAQLEALLRTHRGIIADIARAVRRSRKQIYRWIAHHRIDVERFRG